MNPDLMEFPNNEFYNGKIQAGKSVNNISIQDIELNLNDDLHNGNRSENKNRDINGDKNRNKKYYTNNHDIENNKSVIMSQNLNPEFKNIQKDLMDPEIPFMFLNTSKIEERFEKQIKGSTSIQNPLEADLVSLVVNIFLKSGISTEKIGIISPYDDQRDLISNLTDVEVKTVDGYQGREKDIMIISTVRSNNKKKIGFLNDLRRLNVALTRARRKMVVIGDSETLKIHPTYLRLIETSKEKGYFKDLVF
jgi:superfamily I DNA and/or RNA helicase